MAEHAASPLVNEVYMLCCGDGSLYTGWTNDLQHRIQAHQSGKGAKYTRSRLPVALVYQEAWGTPKAAMRREALIKRLRRKQKLQLIEQYEGLLAQARAKLAAWQQPCGQLLLLREKAGVALFRVQSGQEQLVLKLFLGAYGRQELAFYDLLIREGLMTIPRVRWDDEALLMPDLCASTALRLATEADMQCPAAMAALGRWYRQLHQISTDQHPWLPLSQEWAALRQQRLAEAWPTLAAEGGNPELKRLLEALILRAERLPLKLCYNDFYYVNMVVGPEGTQAFMIDYGRMGLNFPGLDLKNALWFSSPEARAAFMQSYGLHWEEEPWIALLLPLQDWLLGQAEAAAELLSEAYMAQLRCLLG